MAVPTPVTTLGVFLMIKGSTGSAYAKMIDINSYGDLGGEPELIDATTLSHWMATGVLGVQQLSTIAFEANYSMDTYANVKADEGKVVDLAVWFGGDRQPDGSIEPTGVDGKFEFKGMYSIYITGDSTNAIVHCTLSVAALTAPALANTGS